MANMVTPITLNVNAFDATKSNTFYFSVNGGNQVVKNEILIVTNDSNKTMVYNNISITYQFYQSIPANTLTNGENYLVSFRTYDILGNVSSYSQEIPFICITTPTLTLNVSDGDIINNSYFNFKCTYSQEEDELMDYMYFELYDNSNVLINRSPNIYNTNIPPFECEYNYNGFDNNSTYKVNVVCFTLNGMKVISDVITFSIEYGSSEMYSLFTLENKCNDGYILASSKIVPINGESNPSPPIYIEEDTMVDCACCVNTLGNRLNYNISWNNGYVIESNQFLLRTWFNPTMFTNDFKQFHQMMSFKDIANREMFNVYLYRNGNLDYIVVKNSYGLYLHSNGISNVTKNQKCFIWLKYDNGVWDLIFENIDGTTTTPIFEWNGESNIEYNYINNGILYEDENMDSTIIRNDNEIQIDNNIEKIMIGNAIFDHINITSDINIDYSTDLPTWDYNTILDCNFNGNINGGNIEIIESQIVALRLKRKNANGNWYTIYETPFDSEHTSLTFLDTGVPNGIEQEYALVPMLQDGIEGTYIIKEITPKWNGVFISDAKGNIFKLYNSVNYNSTNNNSPVGVLNPIGRKYPIVIKNSDIDYQSGGMSANLLGYNYETTKIIDRNDIVKQTNDFIKFLNNGESKIIKDWNGNIFIVKIIGNPSISYSQAYGNGITNVSFEWVEQGKYDNYTDLYNNGLI